MKLKSTSLAAIALCLPLLACANSKNNFLFGDGGADASAASDGGSTSDAKAATGTDCPAYCLIIGGRSTSCEDTAKCETACKAAKKAATTASCADEWQALTDCTAGEGTGGKPPAVTCDSKGAVTVTSGCTSKKTAFEDCIGGSSGDAGSTGSCTLKQEIDPNAACNTCAENNCCSEWNACLDDTDCDAFLQCITACPAGTAGTTCVNGCQSSHSTGASLASTAVTCLQGPCSTPCGL
ncbi:MAG: hypothetical protein IPG50_34165 [Myxococcales bacterium]|nr:hypothetical protein [Myxococcales bacterium]